MADAPSEAIPPQPRPLPIAAGFDELAHQLMVKVLDRHDPLNIPTAVQPSAPALSPAGSTGAEGLSHQELAALAKLGDRFGNRISLPGVPLVQDANAADSRQKSESPPKIEFINIGDSPPPGPSGVPRQPAQQSRDLLFPTVSKTSSSDDSPPPPTKKSKKGAFSTFKTKSRKFFKKGPGGKSSKPAPQLPALDVGALSDGHAYFETRCGEVILISTRLLTSTSMVNFFRHFRINIEAYSQQYPNHIAALIGWLRYGNWEFYQEFMTHPTTVGFGSNFFSWIHQLRQEIADLHKNHGELSNISQLTSLEEHLRQTRTSSNTSIVNAQCPYSDQDKALYSAQSKGFIRSIPFFDDNYVSQQVLRQLTAYFGRLRNPHLPEVYVPYVTPISTELASIVSYVTYGNYRDLEIAQDGADRNRNCEPFFAGPSFFEWIIYMRELVLQHERRVADGEDTASSLILPYIDYMRPKDRHQP